MLQYYKYRLKKYTYILSNEDFINLLDLYSINEKFEICNLLQNRNINFLYSYKGLSFCIYNYLLYNPQATDTQIKKVYINEFKKYTTLSKKNEQIINKEISKETFLELIERLQHYLKSKYIKTNIVGYRYTCMEEFNNIINFNETIIPQFLSLTANPKLIDKDLHYKKEQNIIKYLIPKFSNGIIIPDQQQQKAEYEILLPHHTKIEIISKEFDNILQKEIYVAIVK